MNDGKITLIFLAILAILIMYLMLRRKSLNALRNKVEDLIERSLKDDVNAQYKLGEFFEREPITWLLFRKDKFALMRALGLPVKHEEYKNRAALCYMLSFTGGNFLAESSFNYLCKNSPCEAELKEIKKQIEMGKRDEVVQLAMAMITSENLSI